MNTLRKTLITDLKMLNVPVWRRVAKELERSVRSQRRVSLSRIQENAKKGMTIVVPGKVLGSGAFETKADVVAFAFSESAKAKIAKAGGKALLVQDYHTKNKEGKGLQIIG